jgi:hypothetical protein
VQRQLALCCTASPESWLSSSILHGEWVPGAGVAAAVPSQYLGICDKLNNTYITIRLSVGVCLTISLVAVGVVSIAVRVSAVARVLIVVVVSHVWARAQLMRE